MKPSRAAVLLLLVSALSVCAQSPPAASSSPQTVAERPDEVLARARQLYNEEGPQKALPEFERALGMFRAAGDRRGEAITLGLIGNCHKRLGEMGRAEEFLQRALAMKRELGDRGEEGRTLSHLGLLYKDKGEFPRGIEFYRQAIAIAQELGDRVLEGSVRNNLGLVYDELGDYKLSLQEYERALRLYEGTGFDRGISDTIGNIGGIHLLLGRYAEALRYYREALALSEKAKSKLDISLDLINIGLCYVGLGQVEEAIGEFDRAVTLARQGGFKLEEADALKGKGSALAQTGKYDAALENYRLAVAAYEKGGLQQQLTEALGELGGLHLQLGDMASAEEKFRRAMEISRAIGHARGVTLNLLALGHIELHRRRLEQAGALYRDALARASETGDQASIAGARIQLALTYRDLGKFAEAAQEAGAAAEMARGAQARPLEARAEYAAGEVARQQGDTPKALAHYAAAGKILEAAPDPELAWRVEFGRGQALEAAEKPEEAVTAYRRAIEIIENVRGELREERYRSAYLENKFQAYVALVQLLLKLGRPDEAFVYSEKLRARSFLDLIGRGRPQIRNAAQRQTELALRQRIRKLQSEIEAENLLPLPQRKRQKLEGYSTELAKAEREYQELLDEVMRGDPAYAETRVLTPPSSTEVRQRLPENVALVEYVTGESGVAVFVLRREGLKARVISQRAEELQARVELLRGLIARETGEAWRRPAEQLHAILIQPLEEAGWLEGVARLYLVPHGILHYVPFGALPAKNPGGLLVEKYDITYLPAAAVLVLATRNGVARQSVLAMAPSRARLQFTQEEARSVVAAFAGAKTLLVGTRATESSFKKLAGSFDVLHLATHGYFNKNNPLLSGVELEPDAAEDGRLEVHEILGLTLRARLVTLSACETALGGGYFSDVPAGDDLVGLTRAFLHAGSPSVMATLWEVSDRATLRLMRGFYQGLGAAGKSGALAAAQRAMIRRGGREAHPYYWGAFVLVGQMN